MASLQHLAYQLPTTGGESQKWKVQPLHFDTFFQDCGLLTIPVFQRTYCWTDEQIAGWWRDLRMAKEEAGIAAGHRVGKIMFKAIPHPAEEEGGMSSGPKGAAAMTIIDGQQRITTALLFLAAVRDALLERLDVTKDAGAAALCRELEAALFVDPEAFAALALQPRDDGEEGSFLKVGEPLWFCRLVPSYLDRLPFFELVLAGRLGAAPCEATKRSVQWRAKAYFDRELRTWLAAREAGGLLRDLRFLAGRQLGFFSLMYMESLNEMAFLPQLFLWLQEKSLFSMGALLWNPSPGVTFRAADLVRNLLISPFAALPSAQLERLYVDRWIAPLESRVAGPDQMDRFLMAFLLREASQPGGAPVHSRFETTMLGSARAMGFPIDLDKCRGVIIYGRFHAVFEARQALGLPDPAGILLDQLAAFMASWDPDLPIPNLEIERLKN